MYGHGLHFRHGPSSNLCKSCLIMFRLANPDLVMIRACCRSSPMICVDLRDDKRGACDSIFWPVWKFQFSLKNKNFNFLIQNFVKYGKLSTSDPLASRTYVSVYWLTDLSCEPICSNLGPYWRLIQLFSIHTELFISFSF